MIEHVEQIKPTQPGRNLALSIDKRIQYIAYRELKAAVLAHKAEAGSMVVLNPNTGEVLALVNQPSFNPNNRGQLIVDEQFQTVIPHIYAVGDVIGYPSLASAAYTQGRAAGMHMLGRKDGNLRVNDIPTGIYTSPEISSVGKTERELTAACVPYEVGHSLFRSLARAQITGETTGMLKLLFHRDTLEILGVHCFGANASEIVHIGQAIMNQPHGHNTVEYFVETTFNYPTMAEAYRVAALNGMNRLF